MSPPARSGAGLLTRLRSAWFGPSVPLAPEAPPETAGRQFDYPVGFNLRLSPRQDEGTSFAELRGLADAYDLVRLVIETRKDQIEALDWQIRPRRGGPSERARHLPPNMVQNMIIDVRGQTVSEEQRRDIVERIVNGSNGVLHKDLIEFKGIPK